MGWRYKLAIALSIGTIIVGVALTAFWAYWCFVDWMVLIHAWERFEALSKASGVAPTRLAIAIANQDAHRLNVAAEIVATMLGGVIAAVGGLGLVVCLTRGKASP